MPGFHYYRVFIDGAEVNDPSSETFYGTGKQASGIEIPEKGVDFYLPKNVPHGEVRERWYFSKTTEAWRRVFVYTPPDTTPIAKRGIRFSICSTAAVRTNGAGPIKGVSRSSWTTCSRRKKRSRCSS